jgi:hydroxyacylglutathione hydrolase
MAGLTQHTINTPYMVGPVHCYSGVLAGELVLFDTGPPTPDAERYLRDHIDLKKLRHVIITHGHIDHYGLAFWL